MASVNKKAKAKVRVPKFKSIQVKIPSADLNCSSFSGYHFAFCTSPTYKGGRKKASSFTQCREGLCGHLRNSWDGSPYGVVGLDKRKTRVLVYRRLSVSAAANVKRENNKVALEMAIGKKLLNHFEKLAGWPASTVHKVSHGGDARSPMYLFTSTVKWMKHPAMLSMYCLLIRLGRWHELKGFKTHKGFLSAANKIAERSPGSGTSSRTGDIRYLRSSLKYMKLIVKNFAYLFKGRNTSTCWKGQSSSEGLHQLCRGATLDKTMKKRFADTKRKFKVK